MVNDTPTLNSIREQHADVLLTLSQHGYDLVGRPRKRGGAIILEFRHGGTGDEVEAALLELPIWLDQLNATAARRVRYVQEALPL